MKGRWTEIFTRREKDIPGHIEKSEGRDHGQGWACTCGCNKRVPHRKHSEGPPVDACKDGYVPTTGGASEMYREGYERIKWDKTPVDWDKLMEGYGKKKGEEIRISRVNK